MGVLEILQFPHPTLRKRALEIKEIDERVHRLVEAMTVTMYRAPGIGLAAPQVGVPDRLILVDLSAGDKPGELVVLLNPQIICKEGEIQLEEGCLSVPDLRETVTRCRRVVVKGLDLEGHSVEVEGEDLMAVALQHEIDHLDGVLFIDRLSQLKRSRYVARLKKALNPGNP
ncbi:MAG: peptide deformylase [Deltaproteobacteria bacterium]|nr:peptide deformylase [Deltaproteobacteria bacterium]